LTACVIDASVAIKWYVPEQHQEQALKLLALARSGDVEFHIPDLIYCEAASVLWKRVRLGEITEAESAAIAPALLDVPKIVHPSAILLPSALKTACLAGRSTYDCFYLALAEFLGANLITADMKLFNALAGTPWQQTIVPVQEL